MQNAFMEDEMDSEPFLTEYNVPVANRFSLSNGRGNGGDGGGDFQIVDRMAKRERISTGSADGYATTVSQETFENMSTDGKLSILFGMMSESHVNQARTSASIQYINSFIVNTCQKVNTV